MLTLMSTWGKAQRPWGYEVRADYLDTAGKIHNEAFTFPSQPTQAEIDAAVEARRVDLDDRLTAQEDARNIEEVLA